MSAEEFGANFHDNYRIHNVEDHPEDPLSLAEQYKCGEFPTADAVIRATRLLLAQELSTDILVRSTLRDFVERTATISVSPTERGKMEMDEFHDYYVALLYHV